MSSLDDTIRTCCPCCCGPVKPDEPETPTDPTPAPELGPSVVDNPVPLSNGMNIPTLGVLRGYNRYYTRCLYINQGDAPAPPSSNPYLQVGNADAEFGFYPQPAARIDVEFYPGVSIVFPTSTSYETEANITRVYPSTDTTYYIEFIWTVDSINGYIGTGHYDVNVWGFNSEEAQGLDLPFTIKNHSLEAHGHIIMEKPNLEPEFGADHIFLNHNNGNTQSINIKSNVAWWFDFTE